MARHEQAHGLQQLAVVATLRQRGEKDHQRSGAEAPAQVRRQRAVVAGQVFGRDAGGEARDRREVRRSPTLGDAVLDRGGEGEEPGPVLGAVAVVRGEHRRVHRMIVARQGADPRGHR